MPKITKVWEMPANPPRYPEAKVLIYIDGKKCTPVRARTWSAMGLKVGDSITCPELKELETHHWKHAFGQASWDKEKIRLAKVVALIESLDNRIQANVVGFGANTNEFIAGHPTESGKPDIEVVTRDASVFVLMVEVTGTEVMRGTDYWVRPDKLAYAKAHPEQDVWLILHFASPHEKFVIIKPDPNTTYQVVEKVIRDSTEWYVEFNDRSNEVVSLPDFAEYLRSKVTSIS
jgi:hypothetical protein